MTSCSSARCATLDAERARRQAAAGWGPGAFIPGTSIDWREEALALEAQLAGAVSRERELLEHIIDLDRGDWGWTVPTLVQIARARLAELGGQ